MKTVDTYKQIMESDEFVVSELLKVRTLYKLKEEIRYAQLRETEFDTESVAEHVYGMHCLADYFLPLEDAAGKWNQAKIRDMIQYHDIDEIETGDIIGWLKTEQANKEELAMANKVIARLPDVMQDSIREALEEYEKQETGEAKFVKALDKIEPIFQVYSETGKEIIQKNKTTRAQSDSIKDQFVKPFPTINRFHQVMGNVFVEEGFFTPES